MSHGTLVIVRHGQSAWNLENRFTGWVDVDITEAGRDEAIAAGQSLKSFGLLFDEVHTSVLRRAIHTSWAILGELEMSWLPTFRSWRLNERHYGGLQGLNKAETAAEHGDHQVQIWRRSYDVPPPPAPVQLVFAKIPIQVDLLAELKEMPERDLSTDAAGPLPVTL